MLSSMRTHVMIVLVGAIMATTGAGAVVPATVAPHSFGAAEPQNAVAHALRAACSPPPAPQAALAEAGWVQHRYDFDAIGRVSEGAGVTVAVVDSGVDASHPQLDGVVRGGGDEIGTSNGLEDCVGHGTAVASLIVARQLPGMGLRGLAPRATVLSVRVSNRVQTADGPAGDGDLQAFIDGINRAVSARPRPSVLSVSLSTTTDSPGLRAAIQEALDADMVVIASAGNRFDAGSPTPFPAAYDGVVGVGAIDGAGARAAMSQVGPYVDIVAPGEAIVAAAPRAGHVVQSGTSFAVPFVAATAALLRSRWPSLPRDDVVRRLLATADPAAGGQPSPDYGHGVVNPLRALTELLPSVAATPAASPTPVVQAVVAGPDDAVAIRGGLLVAAGVLIGSTGIVMALSLAVPAGRRRRWRPDP
jgi:type VII secretion-associated serine protease mycosin